MFIKNHFIYKPGITLLEVMIAIIIFGTGVLVVMGTITSNVGRLYEIREKDTAIMIAKEGMDMVYHVRDSNVERNGFWNCAQIDIGSPGTCSEFFYDDSDKYFTIGMSLSGSYEMNVIATTGDSSTTIWYHTGTLYSQFTGGVTQTMTGFWYNHESSGGEDTGYKRRITMRPVSGYESYTGSILEVTSEVRYQRGTSERSIVLQSFIGDIR